LAHRAGKKYINNSGQSNLLAGRKPLGKRATACGMNSAGSRRLRGLRADYSELANQPSFTIEIYVINCGPVRLATGSRPNPISNCKSWFTTCHTPSSIFVCKTLRCRKAKECKILRCRKVKECKILRCRNAKECKILPAFNFSRFLRCIM
jgi:hypothetical protein